MTGAAFTTPALIGLGIGAVAGLANLVMLRALAARVEKPETKRVLGIVGLADLVILPVVGYAVGRWLWT